MGAWRHRLSEVDPDARTATCANCGPVSLKNLGPGRDGEQRWRCRPAWENQNAIRGNRANGTSRQYRSRRKGGCERPGCTATIEHPGQLDVHHRDGDSTNNDPANLLTLCANCHRLAHHAPHLLG